MKFDFKAAVEKAVEPVGKRAFHAIYKTLTDGLPLGGIIRNEMWKTDHVSRQLTENESKNAAWVALWIEEEARNSIVRLFLDKDFRAALTKDMQTGHARKMAGERSARRTTVFKDALKVNPSRPTKEIVCDLERDGKMVDEGDYYLIVGESSDRNNWQRIAKITIDAKLSRLRKELRNT